MKVVRTTAIEWAPGIDHGKFCQRRKELGGDQLRSGLWELAPGKRSFPLHMHHVTEEALFALSGRARVRTPGGETELAPGDYVSFLAGGEAHQLINDGPEPFVYLAVSGPSVAEVVEYPDSDKIACRVGSGPSAKSFVFRRRDQAGYFDGEDE
jgi:uncharacterized cupin superfamily protein